MRFFLSIFLKKSKMGLPRSKFFVLKNFTTGFALIEVLIAVLIMSGSMLTVVSVANKSATYAKTSLHDYQATLSLEEGAEAVKAIRAANWTNISGLTNGVNYGLTWNSTNWTTVTTVVQNSLGFTRSITPYAVYRDANNDIADSGTLDAGTKRIIITVSWSDSGKPKSKSIQFYISNIL